MIKGSSPLSLLADKMQPDSSASAAPALEVCGAVNYPVMLLLFQLMQMQPVSLIEPNFIISMLVSVTHSGQSNSDKSEAFEFILIYFFLTEIGHLCSVLCYYCLI